MVLDRALAGERIFLRQPTAKDEGAFVVEMLASKRLHRPWVHAPTTQVAFRAYLERSRRENQASLLVIRREDSAIAGVFNLNEIVRGNFRSAYLGYYGTATCRERGYMREGLELLLRFAFVHLKLHRIEANIQPGNVASRRLVLGAGFRKEGFSPRYLKIGGRWRDHERYALVADEWRPRRR